MHFERDPLNKPLKAEEILAEHNVAPREVLVHQFGNEVRAMVAEETSGIDPLYTVGSAVMGKELPYEAAVMKAVANAIHTDTAEKTQLLSHEINPDTGEVLLQANNPRSGVIFAEGESFADAAVKISTALQLVS